jgi:phage replication O-like protein O
MADKDLQVECGNYTRIANKIIDELAKAKLPGSELSVCLVVLRQTYGFNKTEDELSLTQFQEKTGLSRPSVIKALKNLQARNILFRLDSDGRAGAYSWKFNKYNRTWRLVNTPLLVKSGDTTSKLNDMEVVNTPLHTKDNTKDNIQKTPLQEVVAHYFLLRGWSQFSKEDFAKKRILYARFVKPGKDLLEMCDGNVQEAKNKLDIIARWAQAREIDWGIETVFKRWFDLDKLPQEKPKRPTADGMPAFQKNGRWFAKTPEGDTVEIDTKFIPIIYV